MKKGFTLIELLVVIGIISVLATVILTSLSSARLKSRDASIRAQLIEYRTLLEQNFNDVGSYSNLLTYSWLNDTTTCNANFLGTYAAKAREVCVSLVSKSNGSGPWGDYRFYAGESTSDPLKYSIFIWLPGKQKYLCIGSSGTTSDTTDPSNAWNQPGCYQNP